MQKSNYKELKIESQSPNKFITNSDNIGIGFQKIEQNYMNI